MLPVAVSLLLWSVRI
ncbi:hypothetical protein EE612_053170 [Oryza sativa]|nr:hypothetical protein EE612_053170 [Oryza sativa]